MDFPVFKYHPDPVASGSVVKSDIACACCGEAKGYIYKGGVYSEEDGLDDALCPWCIADDSAHRKFDASFNDAENLYDQIPAEVADEVEFRTPGYAGWQQEHWLACCGDAAAFREPVGYAEIAQRYPFLESVLMQHIAEDWGMTGSAATQFYKSLDRERGPTAYVFTCLHCKASLAYIDSP
ncbi:MAG TPA: CbrC family protein [Rhizomicrobium sp.]|nr:CbrC family protein [Rhizomicrobium sp.]